MTSELILHLARRAIKRPEDLRASEIKRLGLWIELAYRERERGLGRDYTTFTREASNRLEIGRRS